MAYPLRLAVFSLVLLSLTGCDSYRVKGRITYDGAAIDKLTPVQPKFWCRDEDKNVAVSAQIQYRNGFFIIKEIPPGNYGLSVDIDANPENPHMYPGDYRAWTRFSVMEGSKTEHDVELSRILHLVSPQDNGNVMQHWDAECEEKTLLPAPVVLSWEPLGDDVYYDYQIARMGCAPYRTLDAMAGASTRETTVSVELPQSRPQEFYQFSVTARKNGKTIGTLMTHGANGYGWDYRFRVK